MTQTAGAGTPRTSFLTEVRDAVTPRATLLVIGVIALQLLFVASYVGALHDPRPRDVPFGVVAPRAAAEQTVSRLRQIPGGPLDARTVTDAAAARRQIMNRDIDGALVVDPSGTTDTLLVASGGGAALANTLGALTTALEKSERRTVRVVDLAPASDQDFDGLSSFYLVVGWCVGGYLAASILAISSGARPANPRRAAIRLAVMALIAITGGLGGAVIVGPVLGALPGSVWALWGLGALITFAVGAATLALQGPLRDRRDRARHPADRDRGKPERGRRLPAAHAAALLEGDRAGPAARRRHLGRPLDRLLQGQRRDRLAAGALRLGGGGKRGGPPRGVPAREAPCPGRGLPPARVTGPHPGGSPAPRPVGAGLPPQRCAVSRSGRRSLKAPR